MKVFNKAKNEVEKKLTISKSNFIKFSKQCLLKIAEIIKLQFEEATLEKNPKSKENDEKVEKIEKEKQAKLARMKEEFKSLLGKAQKAFAFYRKRASKFEKMLKAKHIEFTTMYLNSKNKLDKNLPIVRAKIVGMLKKISMQIMKKLNEIGITKEVM